MKTNITIFSVFLFSFFCFGQEKEIKDILKNIEIPNSPALIILDEASTEIERPKTTKALAFSIINSFKDSGGIPNSYAFEVTPFWMIKRENMTSLKYAGYNIEKSRQNIFHNISKASISIGYVMNEDKELSLKKSSFSFGVRTNIITIRSKNIIDSIRNTDSKLQRNLYNDDELLENYLLQKGITGEQIENYVKEKENFYRNILPNMNSKKLTEKEILEKKFAYKKLLETPPIFAIDFASAYSTFFQNNSFSNNHFGKFGAWLSINSGIDLAPKNKEIDNYLNFYVITRYLVDGTQVNSKNEYFRSNNFDLGGKAEFTYDKFSISYEYIYRMNDVENTKRSNGMISYRISDGLFLTGAFGKNFGNKDNLISLLGINWGLNSKRESIFIK